MPENSFEEEFVEPHLVEEFDSKGDLLVGNIYELLNRKHWKFGEDDGSSHPGACFDFDVNRREAHLLKGTSQDPGRRSAGYVDVQPTPENGLTKTTYFAVNLIHRFRSRVIENAHHDRLRGKLSTDDLDRIRFGLNEFTREED